MVTTYLGLDQLSRIVFSSRSAQLKAAISRGVKIGIVAVVIVLIAASGYIAIRFSAKTITPSSSSTTSSSTSASSSGSSYSTSYSTSSSTSTSSISYCCINDSVLVDESPSGPYDSLDPAYGFFTVDGYFASVFQSLVAYNGNNSLQVVPSLASAYTVSSNYEYYTFTMRPDTWFSNKDPVNAYVAWFSFVRELYWNAPTTVGISNYRGLTVNGTTDITPDGNVWPDGLRNALINAGVRNNENSLTLALNQMLSNFNARNSTQLSVMSYPNQAYVAINSSTFQINLIQPYSNFLYVLPPQWGAIQDPIYIDSHGGVMNNTGPAGNSVLTNFNNNGMPGTGPYAYQPNPNFTCCVLTLNKNPNYWGANITTGPDQAAHIPTIVMKFGLLPDTSIGDFASGNAQIISPPISNLNQSYGEYLANNPRTSFSQLLYNTGYSLGEIGYSMNTQVYPTNITLLRQAIVHAVNYSAIEQELYTVNGTILGELYLPPAPPGYGPLDNPQNIPLYSYNISLALQLTNEAGLQNNFSLKLPNNTIIGNTSAPLLPSIPLGYIVPLTPQAETETAIISEGLANIGIELSTYGIPPGCGYGPCLNTPQNTPPIYMNGVAWVADWADPVFQQFYYVGTTVVNQPNWLNNGTLNALLAKIPFEANSTQQLLDTEQAYEIFTQLATIIQMPLQANYFLVQPYVRNFEYSAFQFAILYNMVTIS